MHTTGQAPASGMAPLGCSDRRRCLTSRELQPPGLRLPHAPPRPHTHARLGTRSGSCCSCVCPLRRRTGTRRTRSKRRTSGRAMTQRLPSCAHCWSRRRRRRTAPRARRGGGRGPQGRGRSRLCARAVAGHAGAVAHSRAMRTAPARDADSQRPARPAAHPACSAQVQPQRVAQRAQHSVGGGGGLFSDRPGHLNGVLVCGWSLRVWVWGWWWVGVESLRAAVGRVLRPTVCKRRRWAAALGSACQLASSSSRGFRRRLHATPRAIAAPRQTPLPRHNPSPPHPALVGWLPTTF